MKKLLSLLLVCVLLLSVLPTAAFAERTDDLADTGAQADLAESGVYSMDGQYIYDFNGDGTVTYRMLPKELYLTGKIFYWYSIPTMIDGYPVTALGDTSLTIDSKYFYVPACIKRFSDGNFKNNHHSPLAVVYEKVTPSSHHSGNKNDFFYPLYEYHLKDDGTAILDMIRPNGKNPQVIPDTLWDGTKISEIRPQAFCGLPGVSGVSGYFFKVEISHIFDSIEQGFFSGFDGASLTLHVTGETQIANGAFDGCSCRESTGIILNVVGDKDIPTGFCPSDPGHRYSVNIGGEIKQVKGGAFSRTLIGDITINGNVETVGANAFSFTNAESLTLMRGVKTIGEKAFYRCGFTEVTIPKSVTQIGSQAFGYAFDADHETVVKIDGFTIYGYRNTAAERYANENGFTFVPLDNFDLWLGKTQVTADNMDDIFGDGKASFDPDTNTLVLNDPTITGVHSYTANDTAKIYTTLPNLTLTGSYHMTAAEAEYGIRAECCGLKFEGDFTFMGAEAGVANTGEGDASNYCIMINSGSLISSGKYALISEPKRYIYFNDGTSKVDLNGSECILKSDTNFISISGSLRLITPKGGRIITDDYKKMNFYESDGTTLAKHILLLSYDVKAYDLWLGSTQVTSENQNDILHDGKASFDPETNILTLNNAKITDHYEDGDYTYAIYSKLTSDLTVKGSGKIGTTATRSGIVIAGGGLILDGDFTITGSEYGISSMKGVTFSGGKTTVNGRVIGVLGPVTISAQIARLEVTGSDYAIGSLAGVVIDPEITYVLPKNGTIKDNIISDKDGNPAPHVILEGKPSFILGDADDDGDVTIFDATCVQRYLAQLPVTKFSETAADADEDGDVTIFDATAIQRYLAQLPTNPNIGKIV